MKKGKENPIKSIEDFADVVLKLLNPGVPYGKMHPQKLKLVEKLKKREEVLTQHHQAKVREAYERGVADGTGKPLLAIENVREAERERCIATVQQSRTVDEHSGVSVHCETARQQAIADLLTPTKTDKQSNHD